jgi:hypothetical protein
MIITDVHDFRPIVFNSKENTINRPKWTLNTQLDKEVSGVKPDMRLRSSPKLLSKNDTWGLHLFSSSDISALGKAHIHFKWRLSHLPFVPFFKRIPRVYLVNNKAICFTGASFTSIEKGRNWAQQQSPLEPRPCEVKSLSPPGAPSTLP